MLKKLLPSIGLIALIIVSRLLPHPANFAAVTGATLAGAVYGHSRYRWLIPMLGMLLSDLIIGFYHPAIMASVYGSFIVIYCIGLVLRKEKTVLNGIGAALASSMIFFVITNGFVWLFGSLYPHTLAGLGSAYALAIPFFKSTVAGDLFYFALSASVFEVVRAASYRSSLQLSPAQLFKSARKPSPLN